MVYDLTASMLRKVLPKAMTWRTALVLTQAGVQYSEYSQKKPKGADPRYDFPGFDLDRIARDLKVYLGPEARSLRSRGENYNEVLGHLWYLTTKRSFPEGHSIVSYRAEASTEEHKVFTLGLLGDKLHRALEPHYPFLLSPHSKSYWTSMLLCGALWAEHALTPDAICTYTGMTTKQIDEAIARLAKGFTAKSSSGEIRNYKGEVRLSKGKLRLPNELIFFNEPADEVELDNLEFAPVATPAPIRVPAGRPATPAQRSADRELQETQSVAGGIVYRVTGDLATLIRNEAALRGVSAEELAADFLNPRLAEVRGILISLTKQRLDEQKAQLESQYALLTATAQSLGIKP